MSLIWTCDFPASLTGLDVTVFDDTGDTVATDALGAVVAGVVPFSVTLDQGEYVAVVTSSTQAEFGHITHASDHPAVVTAALTLDVPASIAAGGGGGVALSTATEDFFLEMNTPTENGGSLVFDSTLPDGITEPSPGSYIGFAPGYYRFDYSIEITQPDHLYVARAVVAVDGWYYTTGNESIYPDGPEQFASKLLGSVHAPISATDKVVSISAARACVDGTPTPPDLAPSYAYISVTRIG